VNSDDAYLEVHPIREERPPPPTKCCTVQLVVAAVAVAVLVAAGAVGHALGQTSSVSFPAAVYPPPSPNRFGLPSASGGTVCPSLDGVVASSAPPVAHLDKVLARWGRSVVADLQATDRSFWAAVVSEEGTAEVSSSARVRGRPSYTSVVQQTSKSDYADLLVNTCGEAVVDQSWELLSCPGTPNHGCNSEPGLTGHSFFLDRRGHWLLWYVYP
jgi:hypothetical protein